MKWLRTWLKPYTIAILFHEVRRVSALIMVHNEEIVLYQ